MAHRALSLAFALIVAAGTACESGRRNVENGSETETKGKVESAVGDVTGNDRTKADGQTDQDKGRAQKAVGKAQEKLDHAVDPAH
jgi:uncharacterized protein YjbJ (UPF0337 family)